MNVFQCLESVVNGYWWEWMAGTWIKMPQPNRYNTAPWAEYRRILPWINYLDKWR